MKTTKFKYTVWCYPTEKSNSLSPETEVVNCVTLAEARMVASRYFHATIECTGMITYHNGVEVENIRKKNT